MTADNTIIFQTVRPWLDAQGFNRPGRVEALNAACAAFLASATGKAADAAALESPTLAWSDFVSRLTNGAAPALAPQDYALAALKLGGGVTPKHMMASKKIEAPRGAFDEHGRPTILFERHVFARNTMPKGRFNASHPDLSGSPYGPGGYGAFSAQYQKLERAFALDPVAAVEGCSWGAFQVLGENAVSLGYESAIAMALELATGEAAHLESYVRFIQHNGLVDELAACHAGDPASCIPFVSRYNGEGFRQFSYHVKFAEALR